jgi:hypothetical protein
MSDRFIAGINLNYRPPKRSGIVVAAVHTADAADNLEDALAAHGQAASSIR